MSEYENAVLAQVVADGNLAAEGVAPAVEAELIEIVGARLHQNRNMRLGQPDGVGDSLFIAKIRQADQDAFDAIAVFAQ